MNLDENRASAVPFDDVSRRQAGFLIVACLDVKIRLDEFDVAGVAAFGEKKNIIDRFECGDKCGTMAFADDGTFGAFVLTDRFIGVDADHKKVAHGAGAFEKIGMTGMKKIKRAGSETDDLPLLTALPANGCDFVARKNFIIDGFHER